jgi:hypothetical protein
MKIDFNDNQQVLGFITPAFYNVQAEVEQIKFPSFDYASFIPVVTEGAEWARGALFRSSETAGRARWISGKGFDMPYADSTQRQFLQPFDTAGIGFEWTLEELRTAALEGRDLGADKARDARLVAEEMLFNIAMTGDADKGWPGLVNDPLVTAVDAPADGAGAARTFDSKIASPHLILRDVNSAIIGVTTDTRETEIANALLLPTSTLQLLGSQRIGDTTMTILEFLRTNNAYTALTGLPLTIRGLRSLETAGPTATKRMIAYNRDPSVVRFHLPMPHTFLPPFQKSSMSWEVAGIMRTGGTEIRRPRSVRYLDRI